MDMKKHLIDLSSQTPILDIASYGRGAPDPSRRRNASSSLAR
jgi:hypothetical protein